MSNVHVSVVKELSGKGSNGPRRRLVLDALGERVGHILRGDGGEATGSTVLHATQDAVSNSSVYDAAEGDVVETIEAAGVTVAVVKLLEDGGVVQPGADGGATVNGRREEAEINDGDARGVSSVAGPHVELDKLSSTVGSEVAFEVDCDHREEVVLHESVQFGLGDGGPTGEGVGCGDVGRTTRL